jgi:hypothetical protein
MKGACNLDCGEQRFEVIREPINQRVKGHSESAVERVRWCRMSALFALTRTMMTDSRMRLISRFAGPADL